MGSHLSSVVWEYENPMAYGLNKIKLMAEELKQRSAENATDRVGELKAARNNS